MEAQTGRLGSKRQLKEFYLNLDLSYIPMACTRGAVVFDENEGSFFLVAMC